MNSTNNENGQRIVKNTIPPYLINEKEGGCFGLAPKFTSQV